MFAIPLFGPWRSLWEKQDSTLHGLAASADLLATQRNRGRRKPPRAEPGYYAPDRERLDRSILELGKTGSRTAFLRVLRCLLRLQPLLEASRWPRWLELEAALAHASNEGDVLLAALILRTQIEELGKYERMQEITAFTAKFTTDGVAGHPAPETVVWLIGAVEFLRRYVLNRTVAVSHSEQRCHDSVAVPESLQSVRQALNDYFHPNFGSHMVVLHPNEATAGRVVLSAFTKVYRSFLGLRWTSERGNSDLALERTDPRADTEADLFADTTLAAIRELAPVYAEPDDHLTWLLNLEEMAERETIASSALRSLASLDVKSSELADIVVDLKRWTGRLLEELDAGYSGVSLTVILDDRVRCPSPLTTPQLRWDYASLRREASALEAEVPQVPFARTPLPDAWLAFIRRTLLFSAQLLEFKLSVYRARVVALLNRRLVLGAALCVRAMLEHHGVFFDMVSAVQAEWRDIERTVAAGRLPQRLPDLEIQLARFLLCTKGSVERTTEWRRRLSTNAKPPPSLSPAIEKSFPGDPNIGGWYPLLSRIVHGSGCTGGDLLGNGSARVFEACFVRVANALGILESQRAALIRGSGIAELESKWLHLLKLRPEGSRGVAAAVRTAELPKPLVLGRDIIGAGTEREPYEIREGLEYFAALLAFVEQEGIAGPRVLVQVDQGFCDRYENRGSATYFRLPAGHLVDPSL